MYLITFVALTARFFNLAAASANNSSFPDIDLTSFWDTSPIFQQDFSQDRSSPYIVRLRHWELISVYDLSSNGENNPQNLCFLSPSFGDQYIVCKIC